MKETKVNVTKLTANRFSIALFLMEIKSEQKTFSQVLINTKKTTKEDFDQKNPLDSHRKETN